MNAQVNALAGVTNDEFQRFVALPENTHKDFELLWGEIVEMPSASPMHNLIVLRIVYLITVYLIQNDIAYVFSDNVDFVLSEQVTLRPDVAVVSKTRLPRLPKHIMLAPDLAVEVLSPGNTDKQITRKLEAYFKHGARAAWVVDPEDSAVRAYRQLEGGELAYKRLAGEDVVSGGEVLPGFVAAARTFFPDVPEDE
jgi:Uma2 family endonuclease